MQSNAYNIRIIHPWTGRNVFKIFAINLKIASPVYRRRYSKYRKIIPFIRTINPLLPQTLNLIFESSLRKTTHENFYIENKHIGLLENYLILILFCVSNMYSENKINYYYFFVLEHIYVRHHEHNFHTIATHNSIQKSKENK